MIFMSGKTRRDHKQCEYSSMAEPPASTRKTTDRYRLLAQIKRCGVVATQLPYMEKIIGSIPIIATTLSFTKFGNLVSQVEFSLGTVKDKVRTTGRELESRVHPKILNN